MTTDTGLITAEELLAMPNDRHCELVRGEIIEMTPPGAGHGSIANTFAFFLTRFVREGALGKVFAAETGFRLSKDPDTVRAPDVAFVQRSRIPSTGLPSGYFQGAPDLAVEVMSPDDRIQDVEEKIDEYFSAGTLEVIIVNPKRRTVVIHRPNGTTVSLRPADKVLDLVSVPGFECLVADLFA